MMCAKCNKAEATHDAPDDWCDNCWNDWWFNIKYHLRNVPKDDQMRIALSIAVERAFWELETGAEPTDNDIIRRVNELDTPIKFTDKEIGDEIIRQRG
jgi:hypothetical protein